ncbi:MAG: VWA domain-containing protein [Bacteroidetes bacterium]|nr:VWA domain-containing protein [Bacteroidota bacterium]
MKKNIRHITSLVFNILSILTIMGVAGHRVVAQTTIRSEYEKTRILLLLDGSQSMFRDWETSTRMNVAKAAITDILDSVGGNENTYFALRVYGHQSPENIRDCKDTKLEVPFSSGNIERIKSRLKTIRPRGTTPIAYSLEKSATDFPKDPASRNIIILITDGIESCDGDPCAVSLALQKKNIFIKPFIIGIGLSTDYTRKMECIGSYYNAKRERDFKIILMNIVEIALSSTSAQVSLLDQQGKPTETDVNMTFYDQFSGLIRYNFYHTLNQRGMPDTFFIDPVNKYDITIHTTPEIRIREVEIFHNKHNDIRTNAAQGNLQMELRGITMKDHVHGRIKCLVRKAGGDEIIYVQDFNTSYKYLVGKYDLEILTLPRIIMKDVDVSQTKTTIIQIPGPGLVSVIRKYAGYGAIFIETEDGYEKIYTLNENSITELLAMQPGKYHIVFRSKNAKQTRQTIEKTFIVNSNVSVSVKL